MVVVVEGAAFVEISMEEFPMELFRDVFQKFAPSWALRVDHATCTALQRYFAHKRTPPPRTLQ